MSLIPSGLSVQEAYRRYRNGQIVVKQKHKVKILFETLYANCEDDFN